MFMTINTKISWNILPYHNHLILFNLIYPSLHLFIEFYFQSHAIQCFERNSLHSFYNENIFRIYECAHTGRLWKFSDFIIHVDASNYFSTYSCHSHYALLPLTNIYVYTIILYHIHIFYSVEICEVKWNSKLFQNILLYNKQFSQGKIVEMNIVCVYVCGCDYVYLYDERWR